MFNSPEMVPLTLIALIGVVGALVVLYIDHTIRRDRKREEAARTDRPRS